MAFIVNVKCPLLRTHFLDHKEYKVWVRSKYLVFSTEVCRLEHNSYVKTNEPRLSRLKIIRQSTYFDVVVWKKNPTRRGFSSLVLNVTDYLAGKPSMAELRQCTCHFVGPLSDFFLQKKQKNKLWPETWKRHRQVLGLIANQPLSTLEPRDALLCLLVIWILDTSKRDIKKKGKKRRCRDRKSVCSAASRVKAEPGLDRTHGSLARDRYTRLRDSHVRGRGRAGTAKEERRQWGEWQPERWRQERHVKDVAMTAKWQNQRDGERGGITQKNGTGSSGGRAEGSRGRLRFVLWLMVN